MSTPTLPEAAIELDDLLREYHRDPQKRRYTARRATKPA